MNIATRFKELREVVERETGAPQTNAGAVTQAAATLVLAEVIQGTTHAVDLSIDDNANRLAVEVGGDTRYPIQVQVEDR